MDEQDKALLINELSQVILKAVPKADTLEKYGGVLFTLNPDQKEGQFCGLFSYEKHVQIVFSQGAKLKEVDAGNRLEGKGKFRRHINFVSVYDIDKPYLTELLLAAADLSRT